MEGQIKWVLATILLVWIAVVTMSVASSDLVVGTDRNHISVAAFVNWIWGIIATVSVLRATVFRRPTEKGWGQDSAWMWITIVVGGIWLSATIVALCVPVLETGDSPMQIPYAAIIAPIAAAVLTNYASEFLVEGFAAREGKPSSRP